MPAEPGGKESRNEAPPRASDRPAVTPAPWRVAIFATSESPRPVPSAFVEEKGTKSFAAASGATPAPLSSTPRAKPPSAVR